MPNNSVFLIFSLKIIIDIKTENINSVWPTALTSAAVARPKATNQPKVAPVPHMPAGKLGFQYLKTAKNCFFWKKKRYNPTIMVWKIMAITDISKDLSSRGASTDIIDILNATTDAAKRRPDKSPIKVPSERIDLNKRLSVSIKLSAFFA